jgi:hypothetical protein
MKSIGAEFNCFTTEDTEKGGGRGEYLHVPRFSR